MSRNNNNCFRSFSPDAGAAPCRHRRKRIQEAGAIAVDNLTVRFGAVTALDRVSVVIPMRRLTAVVGPPGSGKTTLLKALSGELPEGSGDVLIQEVPARLWPGKKRASCMLTSLEDGCWDCESGAFNRCVTGRSVGRDAGLGEALDMLGLAHLARRSCASLSPRDVTRVRLAVALAPLLEGRNRDPKRHLWLDDPLDGLDTLHAHRLVQWLAETASSRQSTVVTLADHGCARSYAHHAILLRSGEVIAAGAPRVALAPAYLTAAFADPR